MLARLRGSKNLLTLYQIIHKPDFPSLADEIAEQHPDMNIKVAPFTVSSKSSNSSLKSGNMQGTKMFKYCTCPAGLVTYNFHSSCIHMHLSFKGVCNKEHKRVICNTTSSSNSFQSTRPVGRVL